MVLDGMGLMGHLHYQSLLEEAEAHRWHKRVTQAANRHPIVWQVRCWVGAQLVGWGYQVQGYRLAALPPLPKCEPCNSLGKIGGSL